MYTYKLGGMLITDELYHDDLEAMTFGRKDQNELMHYGIKGQSWGKRRFQNEDGSLTMAGRNRYDVGDSRQGVSAFADTGSRRGSGVNYNRLSGGTGGSTRSATANQAPARLVGSNPRGRATTSATTTQKVANTTNAGRKAADNLFGRIGNWASNAAKDVGNFATNTYNDASKAVGNAANAAGSLVGNAVKDVGNLLSNEDEKKAAENAQNRANQALNNAINRSGEYVPDGRGGEDLYIRDANDAKMVDTAEQQAAKAQQRYDDHPVTQVQNAAKDAGNWIGNAFNDAKNWVGNAGRDVGNFATNVYNDASKTVGNAANDVGNFVNDNYNRAREAVNGVAGDVGNAATSAFNDAKNWAGNAVNWVGDRAKDVRNLVSNQDEKRAADNAQNVADRILDDAIARSGEYVPDEKGGEDLYIRDYNDAKVVDAADKRAADAKQAYENHPLTKIQNAAKDVGDWASNAASDVANWGAGAIDKGKTAVSNFFSELVNPHYNLNANDMKSRYEEILAELPKGDIARIRYYGNSQGDQDALREQAIESIKRGR